MKLRNMLLGGIAAVILALLGGCASAPMPPDGSQAAVVTRTSSSTDWATPQAMADAEAAARRPRARPEATRPAPPPVPVVAAARAAPAAATPPAQPKAELPMPGLRLVHFDFDRFEIKDDFQALLEDHARWLAADPERRVRVEGHADERGGAEYNLALGQRRAQAVLTALALLGVAEGRIEAVSFGNTRPVAAGNTEEAWAWNRRAELLVR